MLGDDCWINSIPRPKNKQLHFYANIRLLPQINEKYKAQFSYQGLWQELFKPSSFLEDNLTRLVANLPQKYVSICFRHYNAFGDTPETYFKAISKQQQQELLQLCKRQIKAIQDDCGLPAVVTADSLAFLRALDGMDGVHTILKTNNVVHMGYDDSADISSYLQSFLDFYVLGGGVKVIQLKSPLQNQQIRRSSFPYLAAICSGKDFELVTMQ